MALKAVAGSKPALRVFGKDLKTPDGTCIRDFIHVTDLGSAHVKALEYLAEGGSSIRLNLGTGTGTSISQLLDVIAKVTGKEVPQNLRTRAPVTAKPLRRPKKS